MFLAPHFERSQVRSPKMRALKKYDFGEEKYTSVGAMRTSNAIVGILEIEESLPKIKISAKKSKVYPVLLPLPPTLLVLSGLHVFVQFRGCKNKTAVNSFYLVPLSCTLSLRVRFGNVTAE